jgi:hypothetical protein
VFERARDLHYTNVAALVFDRGAAASGARVATGAAVAIAVLSAFTLWAVLAPRWVPRPQARPLPPVELELLAQTPAMSPPRPTPAAARPTRLPPAPLKAGRARLPALPAAELPATAQAAPIPGRETASEPLDLTALTIATGPAERFAGGETSSSGTRTTPAAAAVAGGRGALGLAAGPDQTRTVEISDREWNDCAWPPEADALGIDEQVVSLRAVARADGTFESGEILDDPGHGFGAALLACARRHGFSPARNRDGRPVRARSGIIRFMFTR